MGAWDPNLRNNFKSRIQIFLDVIKRLFDKNNERRNWTVIWNWCTKYQTKNQKPKNKKHQAKLKNIRYYLPEEQISLNNLNQEHGSSSWPTTLSLSEERYDLTKLWVDTHKTSSILWVWWKIRPPACSVLQERWLHFITTQLSEKNNIITS